MKRKISLILASVLAVSTLFSCGDSIADEQTSDQTTDTVSEETSSADPFAGVDLGGFTLRVLNTRGRLWNTMSVLDYEEITGDSVNDAIYNRNRLAEKALNFTLEITESPSDDTQVDFRKVAAAGEDAYDAVFLMTDNLSSNIANGYLMNLLDVSSIDIGNPWWDTKFNEGLVMNKSLYSASSPAHLMSFDMTVACYFDKALLERNGITAPYDLVRDGKWTYDEMLKIMTQCMNLNGDEKYSDDDGMNSIFGCSTFDGWIGVLSTTAGSLVRLDNDDMPYFAGADEKFYDAIDKLTEVFSGDGHTAGTSLNYDKFFMSGRAAFCVISIGNAHIFRDMTNEYGILPTPKFDTSDNYKSMMGSAIMFSIPSTSLNAEKTGAAYDALSYYSYRDVMPVYYSSLCYKGLRDDDSVDMLEIISESRAADLGRVYGWSYDFLNSIGGDILKGKPETASSLEKAKNKIIEKIEKSIEN